ncbi:MAG: HIT domain-containing protein [Candidatus Paceibacterota bacterium]|jgi:diadenosine tetraphosphate (Ap4A) HIT family hydrolase
MNHDSGKKPFVDYKNSRSRTTGEYAEVISKIRDEGVCPFCPEHLEKFHNLPITDHRYWHVTDNRYAYKPSLHHRLIIHKEHVVHIAELKPEAWAELYEIAKSETDRLSISGGTFIIRFGETRYTGASVAHLHAHIVQSNPDDPAYDETKGLTMRIG